MVIAGILCLERRLLILPFFFGIQSPSLIPLPSIIPSAIARFMTVLGGGGGFSG